MKILVSKNNEILNYFENNNFEIIKEKFDYFCKNNFNCLVEVFDNNKKIQTNNISEINNTPYRITRRFIRAANKLGYIVSISENHKTSVYVDFCKKETPNIIEFVFRFSDHYLNTGNYIPAGVINEYTNLKSCVKDVYFYDKIFKNMGILEKKELYTNRLID